VLEYRLCVGSPDGLRSTVWKLWTTGRSAYAQSRMMGSSTKVSLHDQGNSQWSMTSEWYGTNRPGLPNRERHIVKWICSRPAPATAAHVFRILVPGTELRVVTLQEDLEQVDWIPAPTPEYVTCVECYVTPPVEGSAFQFPYRHLVSLPLSSSEWFVALVHEEKLTPHEARQLDMLRGVAAAEFGSLPPPEYRGIGVLKNEAGVHGMVEFVPFRPEAA
jgi:hypothetical protein